MIYVPQTPEQNAILAQWLEQRVPDCSPIGPCQTLAAVTRDGRVMAVIAFNNAREGASVEATIAADTPRWATQENIEMMLAFPFGQLRVRRLMALTKVSNKRTQKFLEGVGFLREGKLIDAFPNENGLLYAMTRRYWLASKWCPPLFKEAA